MQRIVITIGLLFAAGVLFWFFPLFHVVPVEQARSGVGGTDEFDAVKFVQALWTEQLGPSFDEATGVASLLAELRKEPGEARRQLGRSAGLGRAQLFYVRGRGTIAAIDERGIGVIVTKDAATPEIVLQTDL